MVTRNPGLAHKNREKNVKFTATKLCLHLKAQIWQLLACFADFL